MTPREGRAELLLRDRRILGVHAHGRRTAAGVRLAGTVLSGLLFQVYGLVGCLWASIAFVLAAGLLAWWLPRTHEPTLIPVGAVAGDDG